MFLQLSEMLHDVMLRQRTCRRIPMGYLLEVSLSSLVRRTLGNKVITFLKLNYRFKQHQPVVPIDK
jgi:hypothetical protein